MKPRHSSLLLALLLTAFLGGCATRPTTPAAEFTPYTPERPLAFVLDLQYDERYDLYQEVQIYQQVGTALEDVVKAHSHPGAITFYRKNQQVPEDAQIVRIVITSVGIRQQDYLGVRFFAKLDNDGDRTTLGPYYGEADGVTLYRGEQARLRILKEAATVAAEQFYADFTPYTSVGSGLPEA